MNFEDRIKKDLKRVTGFEDILLEKPKSEFGDYAYPCFNFSQKIRKNPNEAAKEIAEKLKEYKTQVLGPYINFFIDDNYLKNVIKEILEQKEEFGKQKPNNKKIVIEYPGPNTNKPLHLGHVRNMVLGYALSKILEANGNKIIHVNINSDRGVHICKSMLAYQKFGKNDSPEKSKLKGDFFVGKYYVLFAKEAEKNPELEKEALEMLKKWEEKDPETVELWKKMNKWALDGFKETYEKFNIDFKKEYFESETYERGRDIVLEGLKKGIFEKDEEGNIIADLTEKGHGKKVLLRKDGTSIYITQDLALAKEKYEDFKFDKSIYVVATEQNYHFNVLFEILKMLKLPFADKCYHFAYGMVNLTTGRMKSREGNVVDADNLVEDMTQIAREETRQRHEKINDKELKERAEKIAMAAIRFYLIKSDPTKDIVFNQEESISFEGETGPYLQYTCARINSILKKVDSKENKNIDFGLLKEKEEIDLIKKINDYSSVVKEAGEKYNIHILPRYLLDFAQLFNYFYHTHPVLQAEESVRDARISLLIAVKQILENGLALLGIEVMDEM